ncbi:hypothetical protein GCM10010488_22190 [Oerskovia jenensis]
MSSLSHGERHHCHGPPGRRCPPQSRSSTSDVARTHEVDGEAGRPRVGDSSWTVEGDTHVDPRMHPAAPEAVRSDGVAGPQAGSASLRRSGTTFSEPEGGARAHGLG